MPVGRPSRGEVGESLLAPDMGAERWAGSMTRLTQKEFWYNMLVGEEVGEFLR